MAHYDVTKGPSHQELMFTLHDQGRKKWRCVKIKLAPQGFNQCADQSEKIVGASEAEVLLDGFSWQSKDRHASVVCLTGELNRPFCLNGMDTEKHNKGERIVIAYDFKTRRGQARIFEESAI